MKVRFVNSPTSTMAAINSAATSSKGRIEENELTGTIEFSNDGGGDLRALVPIEIPYSAFDASKATPVDTVPNIVKLSMSSSQQTSKNGAKRILVKVNIPYSTFDARTLEQSGTNKWSSSRGQHYLTAHMVLTVPKEAVEDLRGLKVGTAGVHLASSQIQMALGLLASLISTPKLGQTYVSPCSAGSAQDLSDAAVAGGLAEHVYKAQNGVKYQEDYEWFGKTAGLVQNRLDASSCLPVYSNKVQGYVGSPGLSIAHLGGELTADTENPVLRALLGERPFKQDGVVGVATRALTKMS